MNFRIIRCESVDLDRFVSFWAELYRDPLEPLYEENIAGPLTPARIRKLFEWKNGGKLARKKMESVERNFIGRLDEALNLDPDTPAHDFLKLWPKGGAIWRIFWLHCWTPDRYPIFDQHVYRAAARICGWADRKIPTTDGKRIDAYLQRYLPFWRDIGISSRDADRALWVYGRFLKQWCSSA